MSIEIYLSKCEIWSDDDEYEHGHNEAYDLHYFVLDQYDFDKIICCWSAHTQIPPTHPAIMQYNELIDKADLTERDAIISAIDFKTAQSIVRSAKIIESDNGIFTDDHVKQVVATFVMDLDKLTTRVVESL